MQCQCNVEPFVIKGKAEKLGEKVYWKQIFKCNNPQCEKYGKEIGKRLTNVLDNSDVIEEMIPG